MVVESGNYLTRRKWGSGHREKEKEAPRWIYLQAILERRRYLRRKGTQYTMRWLRLSKYRSGRLVVLREDESYEMMRMSAF